jgi:hypothetical protein
VVEVQGHINNVGGDKYNLDIEQCAYDFVSFPTSARRSGQPGSMSVSIGVPNASEFEHPDRLSSGLVPLAAGRSA